MAADAPGRRAVFLDIIRRTRTLPYREQRRCTRARWRLEVFDAAGRRLRTLVDGVQEKGPQTVSWDGTDNKGNALASGIYFCRLTAGKEVRSQKLLMLR